MEELEPLVKHIIDKFIGEHCTDDKIVKNFNKLLIYIFLKMIRFLTKINLLFHIFALI